MFVYLFIFFLSANGRKDQNMASSFSRKENPSMEKALFDWPIVLQYDVNVKYRLISRKFSGMKFFHPSVRLTNQIALFPFVCCFCFVRAFLFQGQENCSMDVSVTQTLTSVPCVSVLRRCDCIVSFSSGKIFQIKFLSFGQN